MATLHQLAQPGEELRRAREATGESIRALASRLGIDRGTLSRYERGERTLPVATANRLRAEFDLAPIVPEVTQPGATRRVGTLAHLGATPAEVGAMFNVSDSYVRQLAQAKRIPHLRFGNRYLFTDAHVRVIAKRFERQLVEVDAVAAS